MNVPDSTPTGNYSIIVTASGGGAIENASCVVSVLSANVKVSGNITLVGFDGFEEKGLSQIKFVDNQTNVTIAFGFPYVYPSVVHRQYAIILQNEHTYKVSVSYYWGNGGMSIPDSFDAGTLYVYAPSGNNTISGQDYTNQQFFS